MPTTTLSEENLNALAAEPHRPRSLSTASAKSIDKAMGKLGMEAGMAAQTSVVLGEKNRGAKNQASAAKALEKTGTAFAGGGGGEEPPKSGGGCCLLM